MTPQTADFASLPLLPALLAATADLGFERLTPIQAESLPLLLAGRDLIGQSNTGSGKTAAFALPMLHKVDLARRELAGIVLCPTRELSAQVARELRRLGKNLPGLSVVVLAGGQPAREQISALANGAHLAVGTPGRILDLLQRRSLKVHRVSTVILDEADRMLDMGFNEDVSKILKALPAARQTVLFSATFPPSIEALSARHQDNPARVTVEPPASDEALTRQRVVHVDTAKKLEALRWAFQQYPHESALVFANLKGTVAKVERALKAAGVSVASLHGDVEQLDRDRVMAKFRNGSTRVLVATDIAARGIDLDKLDLVVNFEIPTAPEMFVHRVGRTGRAGQVGLAISLCAADELPSLETIEVYTGVTLERTQWSGMPSAPNTARSAKMDTLRLSGGRKDKLRPGDILGALTGEAGGLEGTDVGKIEIHDRFAYVAVAAKVSQRALKSLAAGRIKGKRFRVDVVN